MRHRPPASRSAFTLIEMMIALALGLIIIYTAVAGVRVAARSISIANRLATENEIIRSGFQIALDEVDLWRAYDDPDSAAGTLQRAPGAIFCPLSNSAPKTALGVFTATSQDLVMPADGLPSNDADRGWDAGNPWQVAEPRTWWRGNMAEQNNSDLRGGDYSRFFSTVSGPHTYTWLCNQMDGLWQTIGYYGMLDYLPSGTILDYSRGIGGTDTTPGGLVNKFTQAGTSFRNNDGGANFAQGAYRVTKNTAFALLPLSPNTKPSASDYVNKVRVFYVVGRDASVSSMRDFQERTLNRDAVMAVRPATWPGLTVEVGRTVSHCRFSTVCRVVWASPLTGESSQLSFSAFGTTLRGARQQRLPGAVGSHNGWATWMGRGDPLNTATLDGR